MIKNKPIKILIITIILAGIGALVFYFYKQDENVSNAPGDNFIQQIAESPAVEGNVVNSGIAGKVVLLGGGPYEYEASLDIFSAQGGSPEGGKSDIPFISVRSDSKGNFQIPMRPGSYVLKPTDPDGPIAPVKESYDFTIGDNQWLQVRVEYK